MTNKKQTRRALVMSMLSLLLCVSMLVGTTFAWFTDSVTSGTNKIIAGNLDVELEYAKVVDGKLGAWTKVAGATEIFDSNALWEPGRVEVAYLKVSNLGTLALKYQLSVNVDSETPAMNVDEKEFKLSEHLVFKVVEMSGSMTTYTDREAVQVAAGTELGLNEYNGKTKALDPKDGENDEDYVALIVYMPENVGNEANYRGEAPVINLGVNLYATQVEAEFDSFGPDYDKDASIIDAVLAHGGIINVEEDVEKGLVVEEDAEVILNLNDNALNNTLTNNGDVTVNGGKINATGSNALYNEGTAELKDVTLNMTGNTGYITNSRTEDSVTIYENVTATSSGGGVNVWEGEAIFKSGTITTNSTSTSPRHMFYVANGAKLTIEDGEFFFNPTNLTRKGSYICAEANSTVIVNGGIFHKPSTRYEPIRTTDGSTVLIYGGTFYFDPSAFVADGYTATQNADGTYTVKKLLAPEGTTLVSEGLYVDDDGVYYITNAEGLAAMRTKVEGGDEAYANDGTWILYDDIDMIGVNWTPINGFYGTFDGNNKTISNLTINSEGKAGFFGVNAKGRDSLVATPTIKNVTFEDARVTGNESVGVVAADMGYGLIENVTVTGAVVNGNKYVAGIVGHAYIDGGITVTDCIVKDSTIKADNGKPNGKVGGIGGYITQGTIKNNTVTGCTISGPECVGGILGRGGNSDEGLVATVVGNTVSGNTVTGTKTETVGEQIGQKLNVNESE